MKRLIYFFLFSAILFIGARAIQKELFTSHQNEVIENINASLKECNSQSFSSSTVYYFSRNSRNYLDCNRECIQDNNLSIICQSLRSQSTPSKLFRISMNYRTIKLLSSLIDPYEKREWEESIITNNFSKYSSGYYIYSLSKMLI